MLDMWIWNISYIVCKVIRLNQKCAHHMSRCTTPANTLIKCTSKLAGHLKAPTDTSLIKCSLTTTSTTITRPRHIPTVSSVALHPSPTSYRHISLKWGRARHGSTGRDTPRPRMAELFISTGQDENRPENKRQNARRLELAPKGEEEICLW